ncbi:pentapeptide repeat-containing protein, partial [Campylobacter sp. 2018MI13]|uniref:pentapeptide repeat-containing protein n=1 Tax=Campylobacter sp. 2018MI13 TaxID=2836737 RepID=UPI001BDA4C51
KFTKDANFKNTNFNTISSFINVEFYCVVKFSNSIFNDKALFKQTVFKRDFFGNNIFFKKECHFDGATFKGNCIFSHSIFNDETNFKDAKFFKSTYFNRSIFNKKTLFCSAIFKDVINFYFSIFKDIINFSSCVFEKANFVNMIGIDISNLTIEYLDKHIESNKEKGYVSTYRKIQECQNLKDSFRTIKDVLIGQNNTLEALQWHKLELYMSELEIKYRRKINVLKQEIQDKYSKQQDQKENDILKYTLSINQENKIKNIYNEYQLKAYRLISDHHSDLSKIFFFTLSIFGLYMFLASLLAFMIDEYKTSFDFILFDENIFKYIFMLFGNVNFYFLSNILMCLCVMIIVILVLLAICCLIDLARTNISFQCNNILEAKLYIKIAIL